MLAESRLRQGGFFNAGNVRKKWADHVSGKGDWGRPLWNVLMFQGWLESQKLQRPSVNSPCLSTSQHHAAARGRAEIAA
jgi:hypothetical protein